MAKRLRARPSNTLLLLIGSGLILSLLAFASLNRPLPSYLVAASNMAAGVSPSSENSKLVQLDLGELSELYATESDYAEMVLLQPVAAGELIPVRLLGEKLSSQQTAIRFSPDLKPANPIVVGSRVAIWQVVEIEEEFESQLLVSSAVVSDIVYADGLFAGELPEVEIIVGADQAQLLLSAIASDASIYLLPRS